MKELKIFVIVAAVIGVIYWGVEPLAHSAMHPNGAPMDFLFKDLEKHGKVDFANGDVEKGKETFASACAACHGLESQGISAPMDAEGGGTNFGVLPPDLSGVGYTLDHNFLAHFIKDPVRATLLTSKFAVECGFLEGDSADECNNSNEGKGAFPMPSAMGLGLEEEDIKDIVAYLISIAPVHMSDKAVFIESCNRCHGVVYDKGQYDNIFDSNIPSKYGDGLPSMTKQNYIAEYLGASAPDLSMIIRAKNIHSLNTFVNNPQNVPLVDIRNAILGKLLEEEKNKEKQSLASLDEEAKKEKFKEIDLKTISNYNIKLPENTLKDEWQSDDDYTNLAHKLNVMPVGKSMPRFGLNEKAQAQVIQYLEQIGDSKKSQRETLGYYLIGFMVLLSVLAYLWKLKIWKDVH